MKKLTKGLVGGMFALAMGFGMFSNVSVSESMSDLNLLGTSVAQAEDGGCLNGGCYGSIGSVCYCHGYWIEFRQFGY